MNNLISTSQVVLEKVPRYIFEEEEQAYFLALAMAQILNSLNRITVTTDASLEIQFSFYDLLGDKKRDDIKPHVWYILAGLFQLVDKPYSQNDRYKYFDALDGVGIMCSEKLSEYTVKIPKIFFETLNADEITTCSRRLLDKQHSIE